ncbi:MAG: hypothetical protein ILO68_05415 [Clostridia bacterium]|nr:hypothetical protein [Clostridia bacterium]
MARNRKFYKGKRKRKSYAVIPVAVIVLLAVVVVVLFYGMQKFAVITKEDVSVELPYMKKDNTVIDEFGHEVKVFDKVETSVTFKERDYSAVPATAGRNAGELRAIFVSAEEATKEKILEYDARLSSGNALVIAMKPREGNLKWYSNSILAQSYGVSSESQQTADIREAVATVKENGHYIVAQISCCIDNMLPSRSTTVALTSMYGTYYTNDLGVWMDPYNMNVRNYIVELAGELYDMGFDEVVLADLRHPELDKEKEEWVFYNRDMSTSQNPVDAICGFAVYVADKLSDRKGLLSAYVDSPKSLVKADEATGQNGTLFFKIFDRVYYRTDKYTYTYNYQDIVGSVTIGDSHNRFIPVVENYLPDNSSWVYIDTVSE